MKLVIDIGNTFIKCAIFKSTNIIDRISIQSVNQLLDFLKKYDLDKIIISSVVPEKNKEFIKYIDNHINTKIPVNESACTLACVMGAHSLMA